MGQLGKGRRFQGCRKHIARSISQELGGVRDAAGSVAPKAGRKVGRGRVGGEGRGKRLRSPSKHSHSPTIPSPTGRLFHYVYFYLYLPIARARARGMNEE